MIVKPFKTRIFKEGEDLDKFIVSYIPRLRDRSVLAVTSKIVALSERRTAPIKNKEDLIRSESTWALRTKYVFATIRDGMLVASAGIDESNAAGKLILLPNDSFRSAEKLRKNLMRRYKLRHLGILITDSRIAPLRAGVLGLAVGYAGFSGLRDYRGTQDIFGRVLKYTRTNVADSLATACTLIMGEGKERQPLVLITDAPVRFIGKVNTKELQISLEDDMYGPLFKSI